jgi:TM2 domain-containing membrane protein YozV
MKRVFTALTYLELFCWTIVFLIALLFSLSVFTGAIMETNDLIANLLYVALLACLPISIKGAKSTLKNIA